MSKYSGIIVAQRDYVYCGQTVYSRLQNSRLRKKQSILSFVSPAIIATVLVVFISGFYLISYHQKEESKVLHGNKVIGNSLPAKPKERWRYIKELESRSLSWRAPTESFAGSEIKNSHQSNDKLCQLLTQTQDNMYQQPTQLNDVSRTKQALAQRQEKNQQQKHEWTQTQTVHELKTHFGVQMTKEGDTPKQMSEEKYGRYWMVQCGSFKGVEQAEVMRARLAFEGFYSHIASNNGWNRVVIGPVKDKKNVDGTIASLKIAGHTNCIRLVFRG